jgi:SAM-dependent methyltransferase
MASADAALFYEQENHLDPSEKLLYDLIAPEAKGKPVLDIGVGGGRTIPALTAIAHDYTAVDYSPTMIERLATLSKASALARRCARSLGLGRFQFFLGGVQLRRYRHGQPRRSREDLARSAARAHARRRFHLFDSQLGLRKRTPDPDVWSVAMPSRSGGGLVTLLRQSLRALRRAPLRWRNYYALKHLTERHESWAILNSKYHDYSTLMHYITLDVELEELKRAGFGGEMLVYEGDGRPMKPGDVPQEDIMHVLARA